MLAMQTIIPTILSLSLATLALGADPVAAVITIDEGQHLGRINELTRGVNMEDLHYQMTGGISSQLLHGESFYEPTEAEWSRTSAAVAGFMTIDGRCHVTAGELTLDPRQSPEDAKVIQARREKVPLARLTSRQPLPPTATGAEVRLRIVPDAPTGPVALLWRVHENHADNGPSWYAGYSIAWDPAQGAVILRRATQANQHHEVARTHLAHPLVDGARLGVRQDGADLVITVDGVPALRWRDPAPLTGDRLGILAQGTWRATDLKVTLAGGETQPIPWATNPVLNRPDEGVSLRWSPIRTGSVQGGFARSPRSWHPGIPSQEIAHTGGTGEIGLDNAGLCRWGIAVRQGRDYDGYLRVASTEPVEVVVALRSADGQRIHGEQVLTTSGRADQWDRLAFRLVATADDPDGRFTITLRRPGRVQVGYAFLQPGTWGRFQDLPIRRDLAEALIAQGTRLLRLNGGMIERDGYRWADFQGPRDGRAPYDGFYDRWCSRGYGPIEHLDFCEAAWFTPLIGLNLDETPEAYADFVAYANSPSSTSAGARRAAAGHPRPYGMRFLQVANESGVNARYVERFQRIANAVWAIDPDITLVTTGGTYRFTGEEAPEEVRKKLAHHLALTQWVQQKGRALLWDAHAFNTSARTQEPAEAKSQTQGLIQFAHWLNRLDPALAPVQVANLEFNAGSFDHRRGLQHATELHVLHRSPGVVVAGAMPNTSQPWGIYQTDWKAVLWTQGSITYTQEQVWFQSSYLVDRMITRVWADQVVGASCATPDLDVVAARSSQGHLVVRIVNHRSQEVPVRIVRTGGSLPSGGYREVLAGDPTWSNTREQPERLRIVREDLAGETSVLPAHSFTVLVWKDQERSGGQ